MHALQQSNIPSSRMEAERHAGRPSCFSPAKSSLLSFILIPLGINHLYTAVVHFHSSQQEQTGQPEVHSSHKIAADLTSFHFITSWHFCFNTSISPLLMHLCKGNSNQETDGQSIKTIITPDTEKLVYFILISLASQHLFCMGKYHRKEMSESSKGLFFAFHEISVFVNGYLSSLLTELTFSSLRL